MKFKSLLFVSAFGLASLGADAQVSKVNYKVEFNQETNLFDCYMIVKEGSASSQKDRAQFNAQYTLVVPNGSKVTVAKSYAPIQNNQKYAGDLPSLWSISNSNAAPESDPYRDFISVVPTLSPSAFYNDLKAGDQVKLFSLQILPIVDCGSTVRIYEKGLDPDSGSRGMDGGDYSNGFTMGSVDQLYDGNVTAPAKQLEVIKDTKVVLNKGKLTIDATVNTNPAHAPYSYVWNGPSNFKAYAEDIALYNVSDKNEGNYMLEVSDSRGCKQTVNVEAKIFGQLIGVAQNGATSGSTADDRTVVATEVNIYPNPASNFFNLDITAKSGSNLAYEIIDAKGSTIAKKEIGTITGKNHTNVHFNIADYIPGMYTVAVSVDGNIATKQLIVIK
jgi:hypothetical protein